MQRVGQGRPCSRSILRCTSCYAMNSMHEPSKPCTSCGEEKPLSAFHRRRHRKKDGRRAVCADCTNAVNRDENRYRNEPQKARVRSRTLASVQRGELEKESCKECGSTEDVEAHHLHYDQEDSHLIVEWLCNEHHRLEHGSHAWTKQLLLF